MGFGSLEAPMIRLLVAMLLLAGLGACAMPASYTSMVPELATAELGPGPAPSYRGAIIVGSVGIGTDTSVPWTSQIGSAEFQEALARTLALANLAGPQGGRFRSTRRCSGCHDPLPASR
jgi:hypothetical protein